jgi:hypothetical protein
MLGDGLSRKVDHYPGVPPEAQRSFVTLADVELRRYATEHQSGSSGAALLWTNQRGPVSWAGLGLMARRYLRQVQTHP